MHPSLSRRALLARAAAFGAAAAAGLPAARRLAAAEPAGDGPFRLGLNTGTVRTLKLPLPDLVALAAGAGYRAVEPWMDEIKRVAEAGDGAMKDLARRIRDLGLTVNSAIGFAPWIVDDDARRAKGLEQMKRDMDLVLKIGGTGIAAPPAGGRGPIPVPKMGERYRALLDVARTMGCRAHLEFWGPSKTLGRLEPALEVLAAADHPHATILPDVYHMYKGGSDFATVRKLTPKILLAFHLNDYPADPPRETINDGHRVYPGDGIAPMSQVLRDLRDIGFRGTLSLELFNKGYQKAGAEVVMKTGVEKMRAAVQKALG
jgi:sugar phosphate isomerase/epimerase